MSEVLRSWLTDVVCACMILALADGIVPKGGVKQVCRLAGGLLLLLSTLNPLLKLGKLNVFEAVDRKENDMEAYIQAFEREHEFLFQSIIEEETGAYISDKAQELTGCPCAVTVIAAADDGLWPVPTEVVLRGVWTQRTREEMSAFLAEEIGIPAQMQHFEEMET